ncbi:MAG: ketopantoate reductase family protein [Hespellia sp.]|jgi:2-dehydropantoate 2-reductase|nr:ketopantoate reductase family protein [Hespellia sp.]
MKIEKVTLIGLGAMGAFFAPKLHEHLGDNFRVVAEGKRKEKLETKGVTINKRNYRLPIVTPDETGNPADLVIIAVKGYALEQAIADIRNQVGENTLILPVLNGVDSEEKLAAAFGEEHVLYAYMKVSIVMQNNAANYDPTLGEVHFGEKKNEGISRRVQSVKELFDACDIGYHIDEDMELGIWFKFMCNVGQNLTCALLGIPFGAYRVSGHANYLRRNAMREVIAIAQAQGIGLNDSFIELQEETIKKIPPHNKPSTLQDLENKRNTEIEMFAGTVVRMGRRLEVDTPMADFFYHAIRVLEEKNAGIIEG